MTDAGRKNTSRKALEVDPIAETPSRQSELALMRAALNAEADAVSRVAGLIGDDALRAVDAIVGAVDRGGCVIVTGMGKSGQIGVKISATLASLAIPSQFVHAAEAVHGDLGRIGAKDCVIALSYSGETSEVVALAAILKQDGIPVVTITKGLGQSQLERLATVSLGIGDVEEACPLSLAPTSSTTATLALGDALALAAAQRRSFSPEDFAKRHPGGWLGDLLRPVTEVLRFNAGDNLPVVDDRVTVAEALDRASAINRRPGAIVLVNAGGVLTGLFTDGDLRRLILRDPAELQHPIERVMTRSPRTLPDSAQVRDAVAMVREFRQDEIPVVDGAGRPVGILDVQDLIALKVVRG